MKSNQDADHLQLLSIFHYVVAGILGVCSLFPLLHLFMGLAIVSGVFDNFPDGQGPPAFFGWIFVIVPAIIILFGLTMAVCVAIAGRRLQMRKGHTFCVVIAAIECLFMPFGTILGVFTIIVLMRPTVKELFDADSYSQFQT